MTKHLRFVSCSAPCCPGPRGRRARGSGRELGGARATTVPGATKGGRVAKTLKPRFRDQVAPRLGRGESNPRCNRFLVYISWCLHRLLWQAKVPSKSFFFWQLSVGNFCQKNFRCTLGMGRRKICSRDWWNLEACCLDAHSRESGDVLKAIARS